MADETTEPQAADAPTEAPQEKRVPLAQMNGMVVRYVGPANERTISEKDWQTAIGRKHAEVTWLRDAPMNDVAASTFDLTPVEFSRCILADQDLRLVRIEI